MLTVLGISSKLNARLRADAVGLFHVMEYWKAAEADVAIADNAERDWYRCEPLRISVYIAQTTRCLYAYFVFLLHRSTSCHSLARARLGQESVKAPTFCHITPILKSLHWLKINERIEYKLLSLTLPIKLSPLLNLLVCTA